MPCAGKKDHRPHFGAVQQARGPGA